MPLCPYARHDLARFLLAVSLTIAAALPTPVPAQQPSSNPDAQIVTSREDAPPQPAAETAWTMLTTAVRDPRHAELRIQALAALGTLGPNSRSAQLIAHAISDTDLDVRTAAILAAGQADDRNLLFDLRSALDDKEPQVAFAAATMLWKLGDRTGSDILLAIVEGERSASPTLARGTRHNLSRDLHNPSTLARLGAVQGASFLLGPFGFGLTALEYMRKVGGDTARVQAIELIAQQRTMPIRDELIAALADKDPAVRAAAAKALGQYHEPTVTGALAPVFNDSKAPVRLTAAAAFLNASQPATTPRRPERRSRAGAKGHS